ncbi:hypothetical protein HII36_02335 [Nonomuraea sp. NN258]|uniref:hypothetical protein n=1 Tax=Nonomuraea antri TaxID=2730852 RepID=UPI001569A279|nr:hypothetical protein [Nonomuraea antri]NRQ30678.1 hypothetical protein [Nonomuraea antri]
MARPSKLTPELQDKICRHLEAGHFLSTAADLCGVGRSTVHRWLAQGEEEDAPAELRGFREAIGRARGRSADVLVAAAFADAVGGVLVREAERPDGTRERAWSQPNGRVALDLLSRMFPEDWRPVKAVEVSGPQGGPVNVGTDPAIIQNIIDRVAKAKARRLEAEGRAADAGGAPRLP